MKTLLLSFGIVCIVGLAPAQPMKKAPASPDATATTSIAGKTITIKYASPSVKGRQIFGDGGLISHDPHYPVWRAGANSATSLHTDAELEIGSLKIPAGDYTLFVDVADPDHWKFIVSKALGEWGLDYKDGQDVGRVPMKMSKPASTVEILKYDLANTSGNKGKLTLSWENHVASVDFTVK
jgi:Protein of unknown function (DUF2911)